MSDYIAMGIALVICAVIGTLCFINDDVSVKSALGVCLTDTNDSVTNLNGEFDEAQPTN